MKSVLSLPFALLLTLAAFSQDQAGVTKPADDKLLVTPGLPECMKGSVMRGDPAQGAYVIYAKASAGCEVPTHWHSADGELIWISGTGRFRMKDIGDQTVNAGMFVRVPSKHPHSERCITTCSFYAVGDQAFDIHYLDASGNEIPFEQALASKKTIAAHKKK
jgi:mannose-6-phosphate isomerase-like protein (cupin superfamily)